MSANCAHLLSVLLLYRLTQLVFPRESSNRLALTTASLHIVTPAGLFLSAPYAESSFSCLTFLGYLLYILGLRAEQKAQSITRDFYVLSAGLVFGIATTFRSNGILNGILFLYDAALSLASLRRNKDIVRCVRRGLFLGLGALFVGLGLIFPQWEAFREYCPSDLPGLSREARPWCFRTIPSVYTWVQDVYWCVSSPSTRIVALDLTKPQGRGIFTVLDVIQPSTFFDGRSDAQHHDHLRLPGSARNQRFASSLETHFCTRTGVTERRAGWHPGIRRY